VAKGVPGTTVSVPADGKKAKTSHVKRRNVHSEYQRAFNEVLSRVQQLLKGSQPGVFPIRMYIAGGAALYLLTGARVTEDIDASFSKRVLFNEDIEVSYRDPDGRARLMYLDRNYNDTLGLLHENAYQDCQSVDIAGIDKKLIEVRVLSPVDLVVTKLARFTDQDREDIQILTRKRLIDSAAVRKRAEEALTAYVGDVTPVRTSIDIACRLIDAERPVTTARKKRKSA
jgi:Nucleotidyltransferase of unknown function (DUF6036)